MMADILPYVPLTNPLLAAALMYASQGFRVHPLHHINSDGACSCGSTKCKAGKHPRSARWQKVATTNRGQIQKWWSRHPNANIGIVADDNVIIDVDPKNGGTLQSAIDAYPDMEAVIKLSYTVKSGSGWHHYFKNTGARIPARKGTSLLGKGIDVLTGNNYVVAPPSNHISGNIYELIGGELSELPDVLRALTMPLKQAKKAPDGIPDDIPEGQRNTTLTSIAGTLFKQQTDFFEVYIKLLEVNNSRCHPPLGMDEVKQIARNIQAKARDDNTSLKTRWQRSVSRDTSLSYLTRAILSCLSHYMNADGSKCFPSQQMLADDVGCQRQTVSKHLDEVVEAGYLTKIAFGKHQYAYRPTLPNDF